MYRARTGKGRTRVLWAALILSLSFVTGHFGPAYAQPIGTPSFFATVNEPIGVAAAPGKLLVTRPFCSFDGVRQIVQIDSAGNVSLFATLFPRFGCFEEYIAISPGLGGFAPNDVYVTQGPTIVRVPAGGGPPAVFATIPSLPLSHNGITFDKVGTFGNEIIIAGGGSGQVWRVNSSGVPSCVLGTGCLGPPIAAFIEGPDVAPLSFAPVGGQVLVASENANTVFAVSNAGVVTFVASWPSAESTHVIPPLACPFGASGGALFTAIFPTNITKFPPGNFSGLGGRVLVPSEFGAGIGLLTSVGTSVTVSLFQSNIGQHEGSAFVDCAVPSGVCVRTQGFWKTHPNAWPVTSLTLGTVTYTQTQLLSILNQPVSGNGLISLAHQLIAAKLNAANGASLPVGVQAAIGAADALIGGLVVPPVGSGSLAPSATSGLTATLDSYNQGLSPGGPAACE